MELKPPRKKKKVPLRLTREPPLPIFVATQHGFVADDSLAPIFRGCFNGYSVVVDNADDMKALYEMGNFGKGSLSRSFPQFGKRKNGKPPVIQERQWKRRKEWMDKLQQAFGFQLPDGGLNKAEIDEPSAAISLNDGSGAEQKTAENNTIASDGTTEKSQEEETRTTFRDGEIVVISDLSQTCMDPNPRLENELVETIVEVHNLSLEEAFFLSYGLGCLDIFNLADTLLSPDDSWELFSESQKDFVESYVAYHHYRAKGWIVKPGLKYGGNFLLYSKGPSFYHASYLVVVDNIGKPSSNSDTDGVKSSWGKYSTLNRIAEQSNKELVICQVKWPPPNEVNYKSPNVIPHFRVSDCILGRWNGFGHPLASSEVNLS